MPCSLELVHIEPPKVMERRESGKGQYKGKRAAESGWGGGGVEVVGKEDEAPDSKSHRAPIVTMQGCEVILVHHWLSV